MYLFPIAGIAIGTVILPQLSKYVNSNEKDKISLEIQNKQNAAKINQLNRKKEELVAQLNEKTTQKEEIAKLEPDRTGNTHPIAAARAEWREKVFFHHDVSTTNVICTPNEELILIDPDAFAWGDRVNFVTSIMSRYSRWLFKILENDDK